MTIPMPSTRTDDLTDSLPDGYTVTNRSPTSVTVKTTGGRVCGRAVKDITGQFPWTTQIALSPRTFGPHPVRGRFATPSAAVNFVANHDNLHVAQ